MIVTKYPRGSEWRKWDLQIHPPGTKMNDGYAELKGKNILDEFCKKVYESDVKVFGITDYFSADGYKEFISKYKSKYPKSKKEFFLNIEFRLNESVNSALEEVNLHLIFNPTSVDKVSNFLSNLKVIKTGKDEVQIACSDLRTKNDYASATVTRNDINKAFEDTFGKKSIRQNHFLVFAAANNDGIRPTRGKQRKEVITDEIDKFSDGFFGGIENQKHYLNNKRLEDKNLLISKKPVVSCCDSQSFEDLENFLGKRFTENDETGKNIITKDISWLKTDPTYEGLKQILYEPEPGERVWIGPALPDQKDEFKVIQKIKFKNTKDFPEEIEFNQNLCSIIGSRSSGKSALLAYIAHSIDPIQAKQKNSKGPGDGFPWNKVDFDYWVEWSNGKTSKDIQGEVVYIPQNYLFQMSGQSEEIKKRIKPVLINKLPEFDANYNQAEIDIKSYNQRITDKVDSWFSLRAFIDTLEDKLKKFGDKKAVKGEKKRIESKIDEIKKKHKLNKDELKKYQEISAEISAYMTKIKKIEIDLLVIGDISKERDYFSSLKWLITPTLDNLPEELQKILINSLQENKKNILKKANKQVYRYKESIEKEKKDTEIKISKIKKGNEDLIEKYQKNVELEQLVEKLNRYKETLKKVDETVTQKGEVQDKLKQYAQNIKSEIDRRKSTIEQLKTSIGDIDQSNLGGIIFGIECDFNENDIEKVKRGVNVKETTDFAKKYELDFDHARKNPAQLLEDIYLGKQRVNTGFEKKDIAQEIFLLTEHILFTAEMEGDKIGGFAESTMTPGKRALFALRLLLAESEDTWPLLIDQPEDNLDSRSIYEDIVPFLKDKKKERQIIMVSHNANLVIGSDSEQIIIANKHGNDRKNEDGRQFNYLTGSLENTKPQDKNCKDELKQQGIREHACIILDGGKEAFEQRRNKYSLK